MAINASRKVPTRDSNGTFASGGATRSFCPANWAPRRPQSYPQVIHRLSTWPHMTVMPLSYVSECSHTGTEGVTCGTRVHYHTRARTYALVCAYVCAHRNHRNVNNTNWGTK